MEEKKQKVVNGLIEKGRAAGKLSTNDIDVAIVELDLEIDELDKLYDTLESNNIEIVDDLGDAALDSLNFDVVGGTQKPGEINATDASKNAAMDDPVKVYLKEISGCEFDRFFNFNCFPNSIESMCCRSGSE